MLKKNTIVLLIYIISVSVYSQIPIHKSEMNGIKNIDFKLDKKKSILTLNDSLKLFKKLNEKENIKDFIEKNKTGNNIFITTLNIIEIKNGKLFFNKFEKSKFKPDILLYNFIKENILFESFNYLDNKKEYKIGVYMFYNFNDSVLGIEFVELKNEKYYLVQRHLEKMKR